MADSLYLAELLFVVIMVACAWPLYVLQLITLRFTPRRKLVPVKSVLLGGGFLVVVAMTMRTPDPSAVYGRLSTHYNLIIEAQSTSFVLYCTSSYVVASAKSLFMQIQQPPPRFLAPVLYGSVLAFQILYTTVLIVQSQMLERPHQYSAWSIMRLWILLDLALDIEIAFLLACGWYLYRGLRTKLKAFIVTLKEQELKKQSAGRMTIFQVISAAASAARERNAANNNTNTPNAAAAAEAALLKNHNAVSPAGALPPPSLPPTPTYKPQDFPPASPSQHALTAATAQATPSFRAVARYQEVEAIGTTRSQLPPVTPQGPSATRQLNPLIVHVASAENIARPVPVLQSGQQGAEEPQPASSCPGAGAAGVAGAAETVVTITVPPPSSAPASASASTAAPLMRTPTHASSVAPSPSSVLSSASADRLAELTAALTKITRMTCLISLIGVLAIASVWPRFDDTFNGRVNRRDVYGQDPELYSPVRIIPIALPLALALVFVWYVWSKPYWLYAQLRRDRNTPFWSTLLHGLPEHANSARYLKHQSQQAAHTTPQNTVFGASPMLQPNAAQNSLVKPMDADGVSVGSHHHAGSPAVGGFGLGSAATGSDGLPRAMSLARRAVQSKFLALATAERKRCASIVDPAAVAAAQAAAPKPDTPSAGAGGEQPSSPLARRPSQPPLLSGSSPSPGASPNGARNGSPAGATADDRRPAAKAAW